MRFNSFNIRMLAAGATIFVLTGIAPALLKFSDALADLGPIFLELRGDPFEAPTWSPSGQDTQVLQEAEPINYDTVMSQQELIDLIPPNISFIYGPDTLEELGVHPVADSSAVFEPRDFREPKAAQKRTRTPGVLYGGIGGMRGTGFQAPDWATPEHEALLSAEPVLPPSVPVFPRQPGDLPWKALEYQLSSIPGSAAGQPAIEYDADRPDALDYARSP
jgi:hypothetical protein